MSDATKRTFSQLAGVRVGPNSVDGVDATPTHVPFVGGRDAEGNNAHSESTTIMVTESPAKKPKSDVSTLAYPVLGSSQSDL